MREICQSGSEGGASQTNGTFLPLSHVVAQQPVPPCDRRTTTWLKNYQPLGAICCWSPISFSVSNEKPISRCCCVMVEAAAMASESRSPGWAIRNRMSFETRTFRDFPLISFIPMV